MRSWWLLFLLGACDATQSRTPPHPDGMLSLESEDLSFPPGSDLAGIDLARLPGSDLAQQMGDLAQPPGTDMAQMTMTPTTPDTCADALELFPPAMLVDENTFGLADNFHFGATTTAACMAEVGSLPYKGPDAVYKVSVPAGKTLTVTLLHHNLPNTWDSALAIVSDCAHSDTSCLAARDDFHTFAADELASYTNSAGSPQTVFIIIDSSNELSAGSVDNGGTFDLTLSLN